MDLGPVPWEAEVPPGAVASRAAEAPGVAQSSSVELSAASKDQWVLRVPSMAQLVLADKPQEWRKDPAALWLEPSLAWPHWPTVVLLPPLPRGLLLEVEVGAAVEVVGVAEAALGLHPAPQPQELGLPWDAEVGRGQPRLVDGGTGMEVP